MSIRQPRYSQIFSTHENGEEKAKLAAVLWAEVKGHLEDNGLLTKPRAGMADRYVRACVEYEFLYPTAMEEGPTKVSDSGGQYANMNWSAVGKLNEQILKMASSLLIAPSAAEGKLVPTTPNRKPDAASQYGL